MEDLPPAFGWTKPRGSTSDRRSLRSAAALRRAWQWAWWLPLVVACERGSLAKPDLGSATNLETKETAAAPQGSPSIRGPADGPRPRAEIPVPERCLKRIQHVMATAGLPGVPEFERHRPEILARAKGAPVLLLREPKAAPASERAERYRQQLLSAQAKATTLYQTYRAIVRQPGVGRSVLLTDGYLYSAHPAMAFALSYVVQLSDLFNEDQVWLQRGDTVFELKRRKAAGGIRYVFADGPQRGERASLLFLDRVGTSPADLAEPLHRDVETVRRTLGFDTLTPRYLSERYVVAELTYGEQQVMTLFDASSVGLKLLCEVVTEDDRPKLKAFRELRASWLAAVDELRRVIALQLQERTMFDEPRTEEGQQDGKLREAWSVAYGRGKKTFMFNGDRYRVFDDHGNPIPPQVCIDFIVDTFERSSGNWWRPQGEPPGRRIGHFDVEAHGIGHRRRVAEFVRFARDNPDKFDVLDVPRESRVPLRRRGAFYRFLFEHRADFRPGDVVVIYGMREDDPEQPHYHSFFVYADDPLTGMPTQLASNAVIPQLRSWEAEMLNAPRRTIRTRIRPRPRWLSSITAGR